MIISTASRRTFVLSVVLILAVSLLVLLLAFSQALPGGGAGIIAQPHFSADGTTSPPTGGGPTPSPKPNQSLADGTGHGSTTGDTTVGGGTPSVPS